MKHRWVDWLFGIVIAVLAVMVIIGFFGDLSDGQLLANVPTEESRIVPLAVTVVPTSVPASAAEAATASTVAPVAEQAAPTITPFPTLTPLPVPTADLVDVAYRTSIQPVMNDYAEAMVYLSVTFSEAEQAPVVILTDAWKLKAATSFALIRIANEKLRGLTPSARYQPAHSELLLVANLFDQMISEYSRGIDNIDAAAIQNGSRLLGEARSAVNRASALLPIN